MHCRVLHDLVRKLTFSRLRAIFFILSWLLWLVGDCSNNTCSCTLLTLTLRHGQCVTIVCSSLLAAIFTATLEWRAGTSSVPSACVSYESWKRVDSRIALPVSEQTEKLDQHQACGQGCPLRRDKSFIHPPSSQHARSLSPLLLSSSPPTPFCHAGYQEHTCAAEHVVPPLYLPLHTHTSTRRLAGGTEFPRFQTGDLCGTTHCSAGSELIQDGKGASV